MADSGLIAAVIAMGVVSRSGKKIADLAEPFRRAYVQIPETNFEVTNKDEKMAEVAAAFPDAEADWLDGLTLNFPDSWVNVRPSNTEPLLRLNAEAKSKTGESSKAKSSSKEGSPKASAKTAVKKTDSEAKGGNGKAGARRVPDGGFTNPIVGNAFKRAVKKYPNAFRRLTD